MPALRRAISSAVEHSLHTGGVAGSIPASPTSNSSPFREIDDSERWFCPSPVFHGRPPFAAQCGLKPDSIEKGRASWALTAAPRTGQAVMRSSCQRRNVCTRTGVDSVLSVPYVSTTTVCLACQLPTLRRIPLKHPSCMRPSVSCLPDLRVTWVLPGVHRHRGLKGSRCLLDANSARRFRGHLRGALGPVSPAESRCQRSPSVEVWPGLPPFARPGVIRKIGGAAGFAQGGDCRVPDFERGLTG